MDIHETLRDVTETLRNILLSSQLAPFSIYILKEYPWKYSIAIAKVLISFFSNCYPFQIVPLS